MFIQEYLIKEIIERRNQQTADHGKQTAQLCLSQK